MSEDTTKDISSKYDTKPTLEQVLERINVVAEMLVEFRAEVNRKFAAIEQKLEDFDVRIDRIESVVNATRSEMLTLRADFREFKSKFKEPA